MNEEENLDEEGLDDPYESELKKEKEAENKRIEDAKDDLTEGKIKRAKLNKKLGTYGNRDGLDAAHYKGSTTKGRTQKPSINRKSRKK